MTEKLVYDDVDVFLSLCGHNDKTIRLIEEELGVAIYPKGNELIIKGKSDTVVTDAKKLLDLLYSEVQQGSTLENNYIKYLLKQVSTTKDFGKDEVEKSIISKRIGKPDDVAALVSFLCSIDASYINGKIYNVDGGFMKGI